MSWLLVALIPGLLMLAAFGLERLESGLDRKPAPVVATPRVKPVIIDVETELTAGTTIVLPSPKRTIDLISSR